jgi:hypothetical protein
MMQIRLDQKKNIATIDLNGFFYPLHLLQLSAAEFSKVANVSVKKEGLRASVEIRPLLGGKAYETALHFCNFALALKRELGEHA